MALIARGTGSALFRGLSSFWTRLFKDSTIYDMLYSATEASLGDVYLDLMEAVLTKSLRNTPVFSKRDWSLLLLNNTDLSFDPAVYSFARSTKLGVPITVTALELSPALDNISMELSDALNLTPAQKIIYPTHGVYNNAILTGVPSHETSWAVIVPTGATIFDSIAVLSRRLVSNKRLDTFTITKRADLGAIPLSIRSILQSQGSWDASANSPAIPSAGPSNLGFYYQVATAGSTAISGITSWAVGDWLVSNGSAWVKAPAQSPTLVFKYGNTFSGPVTLAPGAYGSAAGIATALQAAITAAGALLSAPLDITVTVDGGYLLISSDQDFFLWQTNTAAEQQLYLKEFKFKFTASVPPGREAQLFWSQSTQIQLQTAGFSPAGTEYRFPVDPTVVDAKYIYNALYTPTVILERPRHFRISGGFIYFKDNPYSLDGVAFRDLGVVNGVETRQLALWMSDVSLDHLDLYYNYGYRYTSLHASSQAYKNFLKGLYYFYTHGPQHERVKAALNIVAGIPVASEDGEIVLSVSGNQLQVTTTKHTYTFDQNTPTNVTVGQVLQAFDSMTDAFQVEDYISAPHWYDNIVIPEYLVPAAPLGFRLSNVTTFIPLVGDPGFLVGDVTPDGEPLVTNVIIPQGLSNYSLPGDAYFAIQKDRSGVIYPVYAPAALTTGAASLIDMAAYLTRASMQILGSPVNCAGANIYRLLTQARFTFTFAGIDYPIVITPADTSTFVALSSLVTLLQAKINTAIGAGKVTVYQYLNNNALMLVPNSVTAIKISNLNVAARSELGLYPASSLIGITIQAFQQAYLSFSSNTVGATSRIAITDMNSVAISSLSMQPFRPGSGEFFGTAGDPSPGWNIMDTYLKYNTFRVKYNPAAITLEAGSLSIPEIVKSGRPLYTNPIILPEFLLRDFVTTTNIVATDLDVLAAMLTPDQADVVDRQVYKKAAVNLDLPQGVFWRQDGAGSDTQRYIYYYSANAKLALTNISPDTGTLTFTSTAPGLKDVNHLIEVTDLSHIKPADASVFNSVGIFNRGKAVGGVVFNTHTIGAGPVGGIYQADLKGTGNNAHWVQGFDKASVYFSATHVFVIDANMKSNGLDPFAAGVTQGDFITLKNFSDPQNNGTFAVLNYFRDVQYLGQKDIHGNPIIVDLVFYRNNNFTDTTQENFVHLTVPPFATIAFSPKGSTLSNQWLVVLQPSGTLAQRLARNLVVDDIDIFPFTISFTDGAWTPPAVNTYYGGLTDSGNPNKETFYGDLYKISWDTNPAHNDDEAQGIWNPGQYSSQGFMIGDPQVFIQNFTNLMSNQLAAVLSFKGLWNASTDNPTIPAAAPGNLGWYYLTNFPGSTTIGAISSWSIGDWLVSDGTQWLKFNDVISERVIANPTPHFDYETFAVYGTIGGSFWGHETYFIDTDAMGALSRVTGWGLGTDALGVGPLYVNYDSATKVGGSVVSFGEVAFWKSLKIYMNPTPPSDNRSEYLGPNGTSVVAKTLGVWPSGGPSVFPSDSFRGYFDAGANRVGKATTVPKSIFRNVSSDVLQSLTFVALWNAGTNTPTIPAPTSGTKGQYYKVAEAGNTTINGHTGWLIGEYLVSDGTQWVYCASASAYGYGLFFPTPTGVSPALPSASGSNIGDVYTVTTAGNTVISGVTAPVQAGHQLFELGDWLVSNGVNWVRNRAVSTEAESFALQARRAFQESPWPMIPSGDPLLSGASETFSFGLGTQPEIATAVIPSSDPNAGVIGAGAPVGDLVTIPPGYVIGGTSLWTGLIGPFEGGGGYIGDFEASMGYVIVLDAQALSGYGAPYLDAHTYVDTAQTNIESSGVFNWSTDGTVSPVGAISRCYNPGGGFFTLYFQLPEGSLDGWATPGAPGITFVLAPGVFLRPVSNAIRLLYFDGTSWGSTPSQAQFSAGTVTQNRFTLMVQDTGFGTTRRMLLWNDTDTSLPPNAQTADIGAGIYAGHTVGRVVIAMSFLVSPLPSFGATSNWLEGILFNRTLLT